MYYVYVHIYAYAFNDQTGWNSFSSFILKLFAPSLTKMKAKEKKGNRRKSCIEKPVNPKWLN